MENNYYTEIIASIETCLEEGQFSEADRLIQNELKMPYIPHEIEEKLKKLQIEVRANTVKRPTILTTDEIASGLKGELSLQLQAIEALHHHNCRDLLDEIQSYLNQHPHPNLQALLVDTLIDQQITDEITIEHYGNEICFVPRYVEKAHETDGYMLAENYLKEWFESDNPSFLMLCMQLLMQETFLMLPMAYEADEALLLALAIVDAVSLSMDDGKTLERLKNHLNLQDCVMLELKSNNN